MTALKRTVRQPRRLALLGLALLATMVLGSASLQADQDKEQAKPKPQAFVSMDVVSSQEWASASTDPLTAAELDQLINGELAKAMIKPAPLAGDEQFLRRVYLDVVGKIPTPTEVVAFLNDTDPDKRAKLIDKLLDSDDYAKNLGRYWKNVVLPRVTDFQVLNLSNQFERWLTDEFKNNTSWGEMVKEMLTATGAVRRDEPNKNGQAWFLLAFRGADALAERTGEVSRVFLGIQIQCAQCHDHPFDEWKQNQFHEMAAYLVRVRDRQVQDEEKRNVGLQISPQAFGEHSVKGLGGNVPRKKFGGGGSFISPRFLDGSAPGKSLSDSGRRQALAKSVTSPKNPWFAAAFTNRIWSELLGQAFYQPVDDLGPSREAVMPKVVARLAGAFRGSNYNVKELFRVILNTEAYQRQSQMGASTDEHLFFAASYPKRLNADALYASLEGVLGNLGGFGKGGGFGGRLGQAGLKGQVNKEFGYDPSIRPEEVEGTLPQAMILMNNPTIAQKIKATGFTTLSSLLKKHTNNEEALKQLYLTALCRYPAPNEMKTCLAHLQQAPSRGAGFEDILWVLINSTEFQTRR